MVENRACWLETFLTHLGIFGKIPINIMSVKKKKKRGRAGNFNPFCSTQEYFIEHFPSNQTEKEDKKMKKFLSGPLRVSQPG